MGIEIGGRQGREVIFLSIVIPAFDVEILYLTGKMSLPVAEVSVDWTSQSGSKVRLFADGFRMFKDILKIRRIHSA
jgi:hypothetical protein